MTLRPRLTQSLTNESMVHQARRFAPNSAWASGLRSRPFAEISPDERRLMDDGTGCIELTVRSRARADPGFTHEDAVRAQVVEITRDSGLSANRYRGSGIGQPRDGSAPPARRKCPVIETSRGRTRTELIGRAGGRAQSRGTPTARCLRPIEPVNTHPRAEPSPIGTDRALVPTA